MKAWQDLEQTVALYWTGDDREPKSHYYIEHGVKIERFTEDGRFEIKNVQLAGDHYEDVSDEERKVFETEGWLEGCYFVCQNTYTRRLNKVNYLISVEKDLDIMDDLMARKASLTKKLDRYYELSSKLSNFTPQ